jgi:multiple sugar transport system permease protein
MENRPMNLATDANAGRRVRPARGRLALRRQVSFWLLVAPAVLLFSVIMIGPLINMFRVSTLDWRGIIKPFTYIGLKNYLRLFEDVHFHRALVNSTIHLVVTSLIVLPVSFMLGFFLSQRPSGYRFLRTVFFLPGMLSAPALAMVFLGLYLPDGIINYFFRTVGLDALTRVWLADRSTALWAVIAVDLWGGIGWYSVLFFAALSNVSRELYEAAQIDGANYWTLVWRIAFPITIDFFGVMAVLLFLWILMGSAQNVLLLTGGGPGDSSLTLGFYLYRQAFENRFLGYSQAIGVFIFAIGILGTLLIRRVTRARSIG